MILLFKKYQNIKQNMQILLKKCHTNQDFVTLTSQNQYNEIHIHSILSYYPECHINQGHIIRDPQYQATHSQFIDTHLFQMFQNGLPDPNVRRQALKCWWSVALSSVKSGRLDEIQDISHFHSSVQWGNLWWCIPCRVQCVILGAFTVEQLQKSHNFEVASIQVLI